MAMAMAMAYYAFFVMQNKHIWNTLLPKPKIPSHLFNILICNSSRTFWAIQELQHFAVNGPWYFFVQAPSSYFTRFVLVSEAQKFSVSPSDVTVHEK